MLLCICSVIDHRIRQNVVRTSVTLLAIASCATFLCLPHFDVICDLLLNRRTATWYLFVNLTACRVHVHVNNSFILWVTVFRYRMANTIGIFEVERLPCLRRTVFGFDPHMT